MPHVIVKLWPGRSEQQKAQLSKEIVADVMAVLSSGDEWISVAIEEIEPEDWVEQVYKPDIQRNWDNLYKKPGYDASDL
jgi:4-oxalocrotonate tautomerase